MKKIKLKSLFVFALIVLCAFSCITIVGCKNENQTPTYTVSFYDYDRSPIGVKLNEDDETLVYVQNVKKGESAVAPISPTRTGYEFKGWNKDFSNVNADLEITAEYVQVFEVSFVVENETYETQIVEYGKNAQLPSVDPVKTGYRFDYWDGIYTNITSNTIINAVFIKQYSVTFLGFEGVELDVQMVDENDQAVAPTVPLVDSYNFDHWDKDFSNITSDLVVNAVYTQIFFVSFYDYDRSPIGVKLNEDDDTLVYVQNVKKGESAVAPISPTRSGYEFKGWNKDFSNVNSNLEIMAEYVQVCEVVFWNDNEIHEVQIVEYGKNAGLPLVDPAKTGYRFDHWDGKYTNVIANTSVYAVFVKQYTVTFLGFEGVELDVQMIDENDSALTPSIPEVEGYVFDQWDKDFSHVTSDLTVNAVYKQLNSFNVSFIDYDGSVLKQERVYKGTSATAPDMTNKVYIDFDSQQKQGYIFDHWNMDFSNVNADLVVEAQYIQIDKPILFVKPEIVKKGTTNYVTVSVYVVSNTAFGGLNININYSNALELTEDNISVKSIFGTQNRYDLELDAISHEINFSWYYPAEGGYSLIDNYSKVMELKFEIDDYISVGDYLVEILSSSYYVKDYITDTPVIISGYVRVEEVL